MRVVGNRATMLAKMSSDIPLPIPRCVMSSPIHMMSAVPAISETTMTMPYSTVKSTRNVDRNKESRPIDSSKAMPRVMYRVICVILRWPASPSLAHCSTLGMTPCSSCMMIDDVM